MSLGIWLPSANHALVRKDLSSSAHCGSWRPSNRVGPAVRM